MYTITVEELRNKVDAEIRSAIDSVLTSLRELGVTPPVDGVTCYHDFCLAAEVAAEAKFPPPAPGTGPYAEINLGGLVYRVGYYGELEAIAAGWTWLKIQPGLACKNW